MSDEHARYTCNEVNGALGVVHDFFGPGLPSHGRGVHFIQPLRSDWPTAGLPSSAEEEASRVREMLHAAYQAGRADRESQISKGGMAALGILQELEKVGIAAMLRYQIGAGGIGSQSKWWISAALGRAHHLQFDFTEARVMAEGDWIAFAARTFAWIRDTLRRRAEGEEKNGNQK